MVTFTEIIYVCKHCLNEKYHSIHDNEIEEEKYPYKYEKCPYCHSKNFVRLSYIADYEGWFTWLHSDYRQYRKTLRLLKRNPEFDHKLYRKRIADEKKQRQQRIENKKTIVASSQPKPKCPTCGSTDIKDISTLDRAVSVGVFGLASDKIGKTKECKKCGYKW